MPDSNIITRILALKKQFEIKQLLTGGMAARVQNKTSVVKSGTKEIERLEVTKPSVTAREGVVIRAVEKPQAIIRMVNHGPSGAKGDTGPQGPQGEPGTIENLEVDLDLVAIFKARMGRTS